MTVAQVLQVLSTFLGSCWEFFTDLNFPLFQNVSFADIFLGIFLINIVIKLIRRLLDSSVSSDNSSKSRGE